MIRWWTWGAWIWATNFALWTWLAMNHTPVWFVAVLVAGIMCTRCIHMVGYHKRKDDGQE